MLVIADSALYKEKEELYVSVRDAERRIMSDDMLMKLPYVTENGPHALEWNVRRDSLQRFRTYLEKRFRGRSLNILDVGCGNGWMAHRLFEMGHKVAGVDLNIAELEQAERVFHSGDNLGWLYADVMTNDIPGVPFDIVLFAASCQYFPNIGELTERVKTLLSSNGEIHLLDSNFYKSLQIYEAKARTIDYYSQLGFPSMARYYFHHTVEDLKNAGYKKMHPGFFAFKKPLQWWVYRNN